MRRALRNALALVSAFATFGVTNTAVAGNCEGTPGTLSYGTDTQRPPASEIVPMSEVPNCGAELGTGTLLGDWSDHKSHSRYACLIAPSTLPANGGLPLVVYLHPSLFSADSVFVTDLPEQVNLADLNGDGQHVGFFLLAPEGLSAEHFYPFPDDKGLGWDNWYRNTADGDSGENVDVQTIDHFIGKVVAQYPVDPNRIFITGWSNGAAMAILYGQARPKKIAAIGVYSAPNPYDEFDAPCPVAKFSDPNATFPSLLGTPPILHIHNDCDIVGICRGGQRMAEVFIQNGGSVDDRLINTALQPASHCVEQCNWSGPPDNFTQPGLGLDSTLGTVNHSRWPITWTPALLHFFQLHPKQ